MFRRIMTMAMAAAILIPLCALALDNITLPTGGAFYDGKTLQPRADAATDTTDTTAYTPRFVGDWLLGKTGGSNAVWLARDLTTNGWSLVDGNGGPFAATDIADDAVTEAKLKAVDTASDEDFLTYESTTGDFEWHSVADKAGTIAAAITEGQLANSIVVSDDIKDGAIVNADLNSAAAIAHTKLAAVLPGYLLVGNASSQAVAVAVSGDVTLATSGAVTIANDAVTAAKVGVVHQADTNAVTDATGYTPTFIGQVLIGSAGEGTNAVWISKGSTTNDWVQVAP